jgi:hypothetical protein
MINNDIEYPYYKLNYILDKKIIKNIIKKFKPNILDYIPYNLQKNNYIKYNNERYIIIMNSNDDDN